MDTKELINSREKTHGSYLRNATTAQTLKAVFHNGLNWDKLSSRQQESLDMIASKIARVLNGSINEPDHWSDIAGYAMLAKPEQENSMSFISPCAKCGQGFEEGISFQQIKGKNYHNECRP